MAPRVLMRDNISHMCALRPTIPSNAELISKLVFDLQGEFPFFASCTNSPIRARSGPIFTGLFR